MTAVAIGFVVVLLAFAAIGLGPGLWLISGADRRSTALALSPVIGLVLVSVIGTMLTQLDIPVDRWAVPALAAAVAISMLLVLASVIGSADLQVRIDRRRLTAPLVVFTLTGSLLIGAQVAGGLQYSTLRGNGSDSFNYIAVAGALDHEPLSWLMSAPPQALVDRDPTYFRTAQLLGTRWTTMMVLAFAGRVASLPPYRLEYALSALYLLLGFAPAFLWCSRLIKVPAWTAALTAATVSAGFWAQFVLDERADSHQQAVPVMLLFGFLVVRSEIQEAGRTVWREQALTALTGAAIFFVYPEIAPMMLLGVGAFLCLRTLIDRQFWPRLLRWGSSVVLILIVAAPMGHQLIGVVTSQLQSATHRVNTWHLAYFRWLYSSPLTGLWGFGPFVAEGATAAGPAKFLFLPLGALLTGIMAATFVQVIGIARRSAGLALVVVLAGTAVAQWIFLYWHDQFWSAGKGLSFGYPFFTMAVVGYAFGRPSIPDVRTPQVASLARVLVGIFLAVQVGLAAARPLFAAQAADYHGYIEGHGEYRQHDWNLTSFERALASKSGAVVWTFVSNPWVAEYLGFVLGSTTHVINLGADLDRVQLNAPPQAHDRAPDYLIVETKDYAAPLTKGVAATTSELSLLELPDAPMVIGIQNPNGLEGSGDGAFFWMGGNATTVNVLTKSETCAAVSAHVLMGPSLPNVAIRTLTVSTTAGSDRQSVSVREGTQTIPLRLVGGLNAIQLHVEDVPTYRLPADPRPLLLRLDHLQVQRAPCAKDH